MIHARRRGASAVTAFVFVAAFASAGVAAAGAAGQAESGALKSYSPDISYVLTVAPGDTTGFDVRVSVHGAPPTLVAAMGVHPEYNDRFWRYVTDLRVDGLQRRADGLWWAAGGGSISPIDSTRWRVSLPGGSGVISYRVRLPAEPNPDSRPAWHPFLRTTGALVGGIDSFLYFPDFAARPVTVAIQFPREWMIATGLDALPSSGTAAPAGDTLVQLRAENAEALMDSPVLLGELHQWDFSAGGLPHRINYWALPGWSPFDTTAFAAGVRDMAREAFNVFGTAPYSRYEFLFQDGAWGALEHANSPRSRTSSSTRGTWLRCVPPAGEN